MIGFLRQLHQSRKPGSVEKQGAVLNGRTESYDKSAGPLLGRHLDGIECQQGEHVAEPSRLIFPISDKSLRFAALSTGRLQHRLIRRFLCLEGRCGGWHGVLRRAHEGASPTMAESGLTPHKEHRQRSRRMASTRNPMARRTEPTSASRLYLTACKESDALLCP